MSKSKFRPLHDRVVVKRIDVDDVLARIDVPAVVDRVDIDRLVSRIDLDKQIATVDIQAIVQRAQIETMIAEATTGVASATLDLARRQILGIDVLIERAAFDQCPEVLLECVAAGPGQSDGFADGDAPVLAGELDDL